MPVQKYIRSFAQKTHGGPSVDRKPSITGRAHARQFGECKLQRSEWAERALYRFDRPMATAGKGPIRTVARVVDHTLLLPFGLHTLHVDRHKRDRVANDVCFKKREEPSLEITQVAFEAGEAIADARFKACGDRIACNQARRRECFPRLADGRRVAR